MKRLLSLVAFFATLQASAQQVNPVPDYVFRNQMSVGRNAVTDTAAYFSIGPRYGATKGFMPPIVGDTATFSSGKRNGLLIFSVQKNKFLYWDSVRVQWSDMAGGSGSYILAGDTSAMLAPYLRKADTSSMLTPYIRHAGYGLTKSGQSFLVDTLNIATRAWRQKGLDSLAALEVSGSGTTNYVPKFTAGSTIGNSQIFDNGTTVQINTTSIASSYKFGVSGKTRLELNTNASNDMLDLVNTDVGSSSYISTRFLNGVGTGAILYTGSNTTGYGFANTLMLYQGSTNPIQFATNNLVRQTIFANGRVGINTTTDAGYQLNVNGTFNSGANYSYFGGDANTAIYMGSFSNEGRIGVGGRTSFPTAAMTFYTADGTNNFERMRISSAGDVGINQASPSYKLDINGTLRSVNGANFATTSGNVGIGTASPAAKTDISGTLRIGAASFVAPTSGAGMEFSYRTSDSTGYLTTYSRDYSGYRNQAFYALSQKFAYGTGGAIGLFLTSSGETLINTESDAGDYKLQVVGNARVGTGKLDIASNTTFGLGIARSGTSEVAGQIYNSNGILYFGAESSAGGQIFSGSSAYAGVIGTGAAYPLQFAVNNATYATLNTNGRLLINTKFDNGAYPLQVAGSVYNTGQVTRGVISVQGTGAQVFVDSTTNLSPFAAFHSLSGSNISPLFSGNATWNTTGNVNGIDLYVTNTASGANSNFMQLSDGTNIFKVTKDAGILTANPSSGTAAKWKLGSRQAGTVALDTTQFIEVEIGGTFYRLAIVTPL